MTTTSNVNSSNQKMFALATYDKVNYSPSQAKFTFSKATRFPSVKGTNDVGAYDLGSTISSRKSGLGYGQKRAFIEKKGKSR